MTDIVERLRREEKVYGSIDDKRVLIEAADEIEQLRKHVQNLNRDCMMLAADRDEIERLRKEVIWLRQLFDAEKREEA